MSRKAKMFRAWEHNYPDEDAKSAFSFAWNYRKNEVSTLTAEVERLKAALEITRGQWIHSVNAKQCLESLQEQQ